MFCVIDSRQTTAPFANCYSLSVSLQGLQSENDALKKTLDKVQSQLDTSLDAQDQQRKVRDTYRPNDNYDAEL